MVETPSILSAKSKDSKIDNFQYDLAQNTMMNDQFA